MLAKLALERADCVVARDEESFKVLRELAPRAHAVQSVDVAFALPFADRSAERGGARLRVGVNVSGLLLGEAARGRNRLGLDVHYGEWMGAFVWGLTAGACVDGPHSFDLTWERRGG